MTAYRFQGIWNVESASTLTLDGLPTGDTITLTDLVLTPDPTTLPIDLVVNVQDDVNGAQVPGLVVLHEGGGLQLAGLGNGWQLDTGPSGRFQLYRSPLQDNADLTNSEANVYYYIAGVI